MVGSLGGHCAARGRLLLAVAGVVRCLSPVPFGEVWASEGVFSQRLLAGGWCVWMELHNDCGSFMSLLFHISLVFGASACLLAVWFNMQGTFACLVESNVWASVPRAWCGLVLPQMLAVKSITGAITSPGRP